MLLSRALPALRQRQLYHLTPYRNLHAMATQPSSLTGLTVCVGAFTSQL